MGAELIFLILIAVVLVFGFGVLLVGRSRVRRQDRAAAATPSVVLEERPLAPPPDTGVEPVEPDEVVEEPGGVLVEERPRLRDRVGKARAALTGALLGVRA